YGLLGDFGRFRPVRPLVGGRGDRVVVRSHRGVELGEVLGPATPRHAHFLPNTSVGALLRLATEEDERAARGQRDRGQEDVDEARRRAEVLGLTLAVLDVEVLLDGDHAVLHLVRWADCDLRDLVSGLSKHFATHVLVQDLTRAGAPEPEEEGCGSCGAGGWGRGGCGKSGCGTGGCGSCGSAGSDDVRAYFAQLREQMLSRTRTHLL